MKIISMVKHNYDDTAVFVSIYSPLAVRKFIKEVARLSWCSDVKSIIKGVREALKNEGTTIEARNSNDLYEYDIHIVDIKSWKCSCLECGHLKVERI